jgi:hypothetical protein
MTSGAFHRSGSTIEVVLIRMRQHVGMITNDPRGRVESEEHRERPAALGAILQDLFDPRLDGDCVTSWMHGRFDRPTRAT